MYMSTQFYTLIVLHIIAFHLVRACHGYIDYVYVYL